MPYRSKRPQLHLPLTKLEIVLDVFSIFMVLGLMLSLFSGWKHIPERIPTHFGFSGKPDAWGGKGTLLFIPILIVFLYALLSLVSRFPHTYNYLVEITEQNARFQYQNARIMLYWLKADIVILFSYIQWIAVQAGLGKTKGLGIGFLPGFLLLLFGTIGVYIFRMAKHENE